MEPNLDLWMCVCPCVQLYNLFGLFWGLFFASALGEMVLAGAFATWYWSFNKPHDVPFYTVTLSFLRTLR